jgi:hypothetical protein
LAIPNLFGLIVFLRRSARKRPCNQQDQLTRSVMVSAAPGGFANKHCGLTSLTSSRNVAAKDEAGRDISINFMSSA